MSKKLVLVFTSIVVAAAVGYAVYHYFFKKSDISAWDIIPANGIAVYETTQFPTQWGKLTTAVWWENLSQVPAIKQTAKSITQLDTLSGGQGQFLEALHGQKIHISLHAISSTGFDAVFYLPLSKKVNETWKTIYNELKAQGYQINKRTFQDFTITEISRGDQSKKTFTFITYENYLVGSFTAYLIEDVLRSVNKETPNFSQETWKAFQASQLMDDLGNLYLNTNKIAQWVGLFVRQENKSFPYWSHFAQSTFLDVELSDQLLLFNGMSYPNTSGKDYLSIYQGQAAPLIQAFPLFPERTAYVYQLGFQDARKWHNALLGYWQSDLPKQQEAHKEFRSFHPFDQDTFFNNTGQNIALATLESINTNDPDKLFYVQSQDPATMHDVLQKMAQQTSDSTYEAYQESFGDYTIYELPVIEFPKKVFGREFQGFEDCYYTFIENWLVMGNNIQVIRSLIEDIRVDNTWGKSVKHNMFLDNTLREANVSLFINFSRSRKLLLNYLNNQWAQSLKQNSQMFRNLEFGAFQVSNVGNQFYTSMALQQRERLVQNQGPSTMNREALVSLRHPVSSKPFVVTNHEDGSREVFIQDTSNHVYLISSDYALLWKKAIGDSIQSEVYQVDYYKNNNLQFFFATKDSLHIIDRKGNYIENYPISVGKDITLDKMSLVDYDGSKNYRFLFSTPKGNIYMTDKTGQKLEGWNPRPTSPEPLNAPYHIRVHGRDCMIATHANGRIEVMNRRGQMMPGFPVDLKTSLNSAFFTERGASFSNSQLSTISEAGEIISINLKGNIVKREQLYKPSRDSKFKLIADVTDKTYAFLRKDYNHIAFINANGEEIFTTEYLSSGEPVVQYYYINSEHQLFVVTDPVQQFTYLYDETGQLISEQPLEGGYELSLLFSELKNQYKVFTCYENFLSVAIVDQ